jgi:hypothetical protein
VLMKSQVVWRVTTYAAVNGSDVGFGEVWWLQAVGNCLPVDTV